MCGSPKFRSRLLTFVMVLCLVLVVTLGTSEVVGRTQPKHLSIPELRLCSDVMCFLGIVPGRTTLHDAQIIIRNSSEFDLSNPVGIIQAHKISEPFYDIAFENSKMGLVAAIDLVFPTETDFSIGVLITQLGSPCRIRANMDGLGLAYPGLEVFTSSNDVKWVLKPDSRISQISIVDTGKFCQTAISDNTVSVWHGFGRYSP